MAPSATQRLFLIGHPVGHSKSPVMYNAAYEALGLPWHYEALDVPDDPAAAAWLGERDFLAANVTTPFKPVALAASDRAAATAQLAGGANLVVIRGDQLLAFNVDGQGCVEFLRREGLDLAGKTAVVCGTGPTALSILHSCVLAGAARVVLLSRDKGRSASVLRRYVSQCQELAENVIDLTAFFAAGKHRTLAQALDEVNLQYGSYGTSQHAIEAADLIVDATTLGMAPEDPAPFDVALLHKGQWVLDTVYGHGTTALMAAAREAQCRAFDGFGMLVNQAVVSLRTLLDFESVDCSLSDDELFDLMAQAGR